MKITAFAHGEIGDEFNQIGESNGFDLGDIRIDQIEEKENQFIEQSDFKLIYDALQEYELLPIGNWYSFDCEKVYEEDNDGYPYVYFNLTNAKENNSK